MDILEEFKNYIKERYESIDEKNNTINSYFSDIKQFINFFKEYYGEEINTFTRAHYIEYKKYILEVKKMKITTINRKTAAISIYEDFLIEKKLKNDSKKIIKNNDFYKIGKNIIQSDMLPRKTIRKIKLKAAQENKRDYAMFTLFDTCGLRVSELVNLQLNRDIDFQMHKISILGKGNKLRIIPLDKEAFEAIIDYLPQREQLLRHKENKYLFVSNKTANTRSAMTRNSINNILSKYCEEVNEDKINPHIIRHHCATNMYQKGYSEFMIKIMLGHSSNAVYDYVHPGDEKTKQQQ